MSQPHWLRHASALPVAFAQVREDSLLDEYLVQAAGEKVRICMVASGGCTAAALAAMPNVELIHCVDPNPAQLALARIKVALLCNADPGERMAALGADASDPATRMAAITRAAQWAGQDAAVLGPSTLLAELGLDQMGRYERLFATLRVELADVEPQIFDLLLLADPAEQARRIAPASAMWRGIEHAFQEVMALPYLVALFGEGATRNPREPFAQHFLRRLRWVLETLPALGNPFLAQLMCGQFVGGHVHRWIGLPQQTRLPVMQWQQSFMVPALMAQPHSFDFVHLSNILDWLDAEDARQTLNVAARALRKGGRVVIRQLNSSLDIAALGEPLVWDRDLGAQLLQQDRSFFYRRLWVGKLP